jgi:hypothetical protein
MGVQSAFAQEGKNYLLDPESEEDGSEYNLLSFHNLGYNLL